VYNIKGILCKYLISKVEKTLCFVTIEVSISVSSFYFRGSYGQSSKLAKIPKTLILKITTTFEKLSFSVHLSNTM
jgi:hypothetical protein